MSVSNLLTYVNTLAIICMGSFWYYENYHSDSSETQETQHHKLSSYTDQSVEEFLLNNPKVIVSSLEKYQDSLVKEQESNQKKYLEDNHAKIYQSITDPRVGNVKAKKKIVEFFDYNCGYCKAMLVTKETMLKNRKDVEIIFKELPIMGEASYMQAQAAIALYSIDPKKYFEFHAELLKSKNEYKDFDSIKSLIAQLGIDNDAFEASYKNPKTASKIKENLDLAYALGIRGTPVYIIDDVIIPGAIGYQDILKIISD